MKRAAAAPAFVLVVLSASFALAQQAPYRPSTPAGLDEYFHVPEDNPLTASVVTLGEQLFFDRLLSADRTVACASCHRPAHGFADTMPVSRGVHGRTPARNTPSLLNRAYGRHFFWDGRAASLEETVLQPVENPRELGLPIPHMLMRLQSDAGYRAAFAAAFGAEAGDVITERNVARALASYVRVLRSGNAAFDRFMTGDRAALSEEAQQGLRLFAGKADCAVCHPGPTFTDERFHNTGVATGSGDPGRFAATRAEADRGRFRTPSLRNVALTAPYMHDGSIATLEDVIDFYERGGIANPNLDPDIRPLRLSAEEKRSLVAFLRSLTGDH
jgi:cytochrome c peroxidase